MKKKSILLAIVSLPLFLMAQSDGDYRSAATGAWNVAGTWERFMGSWSAAVAPPTSTDGVITIRNGHTVTASTAITADQVVVESGAVLDITSNTFTLNNGADANDLACAGTLEFSAGTISGGGTANITGSMLWQGGTIGTPVQIASGATLTVNGGAGKTLTNVLTILAGGIMNWDQGTLSFNAGTLNNNGTINNSFNGSLSDGGGVNTFNNSGTFNKTGGIGNTTDNIDNTSNTGTININTGNYIRNAGTFTNSSTINIAGGSTFDNGVTLNLNAGTALTGTGTLVLSNNLHNLGTAITIPVGFNLLLSLGIIGGTGSLSVDGAMTWGAGTVTRPLTILNGSTLTLNTGSTKTLSNVLAINAGAIMNWDAGAISLNGGTLNNNGTINNSFDGNLNNGGGVNAFNNAATFNKTGGVGNTTDNIGNTSNTGTININTGNYIRNGGIFTNSSTINIAGGSTFNNATTLNLNAGTAFTGTGTLVLSNNLHNLGTAITIPDGFNLLFSFGTIGGTGSLTVDGAMTWEAGTMDRPLTILNGSILTLNTGSTKTLSDVLTIDAGAIMSWDVGAISFNTGTLNNNGIINNNFDGFLSDGGGVNTFNNAGTFNKTGGIGNTTDNIDNTSNTGTININTGNYIRNAGIFTNSSTINIAGGSTFNNVSTLNLNAGTVFTGTGTLVLSNNLHNLGTAITIPDGFNLLFSFGTIGGTGSLTVDGAMTWEAGTVDRPLTILNGSTLTLNTGSTKTLSDVLTINAGAIMNWDAGAISFSTGTLTNNGIINNSFDGFLSDGGGVNAFNNAATFNKTGGVGNTIENIDNTSNTGTININTGNYIRNAGIFTNSSTINIAGGSTFDNGVTLNLNAGTAFTGTGTLVLSNNLHNLGTAITIPVGFNLLLSFGTIGGTGSLTVNGAMLWTAGSVDRPLTIANGATLTLNTGSTKNLFEVLTIAPGAIMNWDEGAISFIDGTLNNNGIINNSFNGFLSDGGGANTFNNASAFNKTGGVGNTIDNLDNTFNSGTITINSGNYLRNLGIFTNTGSINLAGGTTFENNVILNLNAGTSLVGTGTLVFGNNSHNLGTVITTPVGFNVLLSFGTITGAGSLTVNGSMVWTAGTIDRPVTIASGATLTANTGSTKSLQDVLTIASGGVINWDNGNFSFVDGTLNNNGNLNTSFGGLFSSAAGTNAINNNSGGIFTKTDAGTTTSTVPFNNSGTIRGLGEFNFVGAGVFTNNGTLAPGLSPGILAVNGTGSNPLTANSTLSLEMLDGSGPGTGHDQLLRASDLTLAGTLTVTETGVVPNGSYTIVSLSSGTISGTFATTNLPSGYSVIVNPTTVVLTRLALPVELIGFAANKRNGKIELNWQTASESNSHYFAIERSKDGRQFAEIGRLAAAGNSTALRDYRFSDDLPLKANNYYRLRQADNDGKTSYSKIVRVDMGRLYTVIIKPNPASKFFILEGDHIFRQIQLFDGNGRLVKEFIPVANKQYDVSSLQKGIYMLRLTGAEGVEVIKLMIQ